MKQNPGAALKLPEVAPSPRAAPRFPGQGTAEVARAGEDASERLVVVDVSAEGMCLERVGEPIPVGIKVSIVPTFWPTSLRPLVAEVVWAALVGRVVARMGVRFVSLSADDRRLLLAHHAGSEGTGSAKCSLTELQSVATSPARFCTAYPHAFLLRLRAPERADRGRTLPPLDRSIHAVQARRLAPSKLIRLGRDGDNEIVIAHRRVSRHHATFERHATTGAYTITDCGSQNRTRVDGLRLRAGVPMELISRSVVDFGGVLYSFLLPSDMYAAIQAARALANAGGEVEGRRPL